MNNLGGGRQGGREREGERASERERERERGIAIFVCILCAKSIFDWNKNSTKQGGKLPTKITHDNKSKTTTKGTDNQSD